MDCASAPERQNSFTIDSATMFGEMYVLVAMVTISAIVVAGPARYPQRMPGQTVFENDDA